MNSKKNVWKKGLNFVSGLGVTTLLVSAACLFTCFSTPMFGQDSDHIWCVLQDNTHDTAYVSEVFAGEYSNFLGYQNAFFDYVHAHYDNVIGMAKCGFERGRSEARASRDRDEAGFRRVYKRVLETNWTY